MADIKITDLTAYTDPVSTDVLPIVDVGSDITKKVSIADLLENAGTGSAAAPSFSFDGDNDTGIYRPGADQLAISTNGAGRLFVDASGNVGIGTASPGSYSSTANNLVVQDTAGQGGLTLVSTTTGASNIFFADTAGTAQGQIKYQHIGDYMRFYTDASERLRIDSSGNVGIGTSSPTRPLHISNGGAEGIEFGPGESGNVNLSLHFNRSSSVYVGNETRASYHSFFIGSGERARIDSSGNVGIGTSSPGSELEIAGGTTATGPGAELRLSSKDQTISAADEVIGSITFNNNDASTGMAGVMAKIDAASNRIYDGDNASGMNLRFFAGDKGDGVGSPPERMRITTEGRVGIGTTSPVTKLHITNDSNSSTQYLNTDADCLITTTGTKGAALKFENTGGATESAIVFDSTAKLIFTARENERMRIDTSGRLLVGTSSAFGNNRLQVHGNATGQSGIIGLSVNNATPAASTGVGIISFESSAQSRVASISAIRDGGTWTNGTSQPSALTFSTTADGSASPTERMRIDNTGGIVTNSTDNNLNLSSTRAAGTTNFFLRGRHSGTAGSVGSGTNAVIIYTNGDIVNTNNSYGAISDIKLKENIVYANSQWDDLKALQVRNYNLKEGQTHTQIGLVAQEAELVSPGLVSESPDRDDEGNDLGTVTKSVNYSVLYMKAVKALQEAMERIETLEAKVAALEAQ